MAVNILDQGFACLVDNLRVIDAEYFISLIKRDDFDYTVWQRECFDKMPVGEFGLEALLMQRLIHIQERPKCDKGKIWDRKRVLRFYYKTIQKQRNGNTVLKSFKFPEKERKGDS